jgi:hypothetical protein
MTALVVAEAVVLAVLALLVLALLRSHAEILRRLEERGDPTRGAGGALLDEDLPRPAARAGAPVAHDLVGPTPWGDAVRLALAPGGPSTLLAFLTSGCTLCQALWDGMRAAATDLPGGGRVVAVTRDPSLESPGRLRELAPEGTPVVMSSAAWEAYEVPGAPYFVYVDGPSGRVHGEGAATSWDQVRSLLRDALLDAAGPPPAPAASGGVATRGWRADAELRAAGVEPDHPSLRPAGAREGNGGPPP